MLYSSLAGLAPITLGGVVSLLQLLNSGGTDNVGRLEKLQTIKRASETAHPTFCPSIPASFSLRSFATRRSASIGLRFGPLVAAQVSLQQETCNMAPKKFMDALDEVSSASSSDADSGSEAPEQKEAQPAAKKAKLTVEDLQAAGYKPGSSLLLNMKPPQEGGDCDWAIGNGAAHKQKEEADETYEERQKTHYAATAAVEDSAEYSAKVQSVYNNSGFCLDLLIWKCFLKVEPLTTRLRMIVVLHACRETASLGSGCHCAHAGSDIAHQAFTLTLLPPCCTACRRRWRTRRSSEPRKRPRRSGWRPKSG